MMSHNKEHCHVAKPLRYSHTGMNAVASFNQKLIVFPSTRVRRLRNTA